MKSEEGVANADPKEENEEDGDSQILLDELNMRRQKHLALLARKASLLRTHEGASKRSDEHGVPNDSPSVDGTNSIYDDSPLLHRSETILRSYSRTMPPLESAHPSDAHTTFLLSYEVLETRATSAVLMVNATVSATVWCRAVLAGKRVDATALRLNHRGRNVPRGQAEFFLVAGLRPATRYEAVCVGTSPAGIPPEAEGRRVAFRTATARVRARAWREGGTVAVELAGTLELAGRCVALDAECRNRGDFGSSGRDRGTGGAGRRSALLRLRRESGVHALHAVDGGGNG